MTHISIMYTVAYIDSSIYGNTGSVTCFFGEKTLRTPLLPSPRLCAFVLRCSNRSRRLGLP